MFKPHIYRRNGFWLVSYDSPRRNKTYQAYDYADALDFAIYIWYKEF